MHRKQWYRRQQPQLSDSQNDMADNAQNYSDNQNTNSNSTQDNVNGINRQEPPLEDQFKNKCTVNKPEQQSVPQYIYSYSQPHVKKTNDRNHNTRDVFDQIPSIDEAVIYQRTGYSDSWPKEEGNLQNWENNPQKQYEMPPKEIPPFVYSPAPYPYSYDPMPNYQMQPIMHNPELCKPLHTQFEGPPMKVYKWPPNTSNMLPGGEPVPLKNVDVFAQFSVAEDFSDLPMDNMESLRFFYNLGIKYFRLGYLFCSPLPPNPDGPVCEQDPGNQDRNLKKKDYCRKMNIPQKSYRTL